MERFFRDFVGGEEAGGVVEVGSGGGIGEGGWVAAAGRHGEEGWGVVGGDVLGKGVDGESGCGNGRTLSAVGRDGDCKSWR